MHHTFTRLGRSSMTLVALAALSGASCGWDHSTSPPDRAAATQLRFVLQPNDAQVDTWDDPDLHEEHGIQEGVAVFELAINRAGSGYTLVASADGMMGATSDAFTITQ